MSTAEKLKALDARAKAAKLDEEEIAVALAVLRALPEIIAVVEAAEHLARVQFTDSLTQPENWRDLNRSLTALDEKLGTHTPEQSPTAEGT